MNPNAAVLFGSITAIVAISCVTGVITTWLKTRARTVDSRAANHRLDEIMERLERLEGAIDTMAIEVERISEGQRFTTRLLAERATPEVGANS